VGKQARATEETSAVATVIHQQYFPNPKSSWVYTQLLTIGPIILGPWYYNALKRKFITEIAN